MAKIYFQEKFVSSVLHSSPPSPSTFASPFFRPSMFPSPTIGNFQYLSKTLLSFLYLINTREIQISFLLKSWLALEKKKYESKSNFYKKLKQYIEKDIIDINKSIVKLTPTGRLLLSYAFPSLVPGEIFLVTPEIASVELAISVNTLRKRKASLCYLKLSKQLFLLKKESPGKIKELFPNFPFIEKEKVKNHLKICNKTYFLLQSHPEFQKDEYFLWEKLLSFMITKGKIFLLSYEKLGLKEDVYDLFI